LELLDFQLLYAKEVIKFEHYGEAKQLEYIHYFKSYPSMTADRLDLGVDVLQQAFSLQGLLNLQITGRDQNVIHIQNRIGKVI